MIANVVIHVENEQPLMADLFDVPSASDAGLLCTNLRAPDGKKPIFIGNGASTFFFPYRVIRFLEIPQGAMERHRAETGSGEPASPGQAGPAPDDPASRLPVFVVGPGGDGAETGGANDELEIDEDFLQRIRDI